MSIVITALFALIAHNAPSWLQSIEGILLEQSRQVAIDKTKELVVAKGDKLTRHLFQLDEKEQIRHIECALRNALERGLISFTISVEREQYQYILHTFMQNALESEELRKEALQLFSLSEVPDLTVLNSRYNLSKRNSAIANNESYTDIDITPYLTSFFNALIAELYADPYFKQQMSETLKLRTAISTQRSLLEVIDILRQMGVALEQTYTAEKLALDVDTYTAHIARTFRNLKIVGIVPKDKIRDPELEHIFVPLRIAPHNQAMFVSQRSEDIVAAVEEYSYLVLLGGPGSGKSTATRYLAWSHSIANLSTNQSASSTLQLPLLSGRPLPLRIELRRLSEERRHHNYDFLSFTTEVMLKREGTEIDRRMFKELLTRRAMFILFDGLDEVATLDERVRLIDEIERFTQSYPGNRVIVTSRPVGYDLARFNGQMFLHVQVQPFNDTQIRQFLRNWYTTVLGLSPIPQEEQQGLDQLVETLHSNTRLHKLAENPLLLTVITELHRYERLPDRRVLIYDRCSELLLETWAKIKGTDIRWKEMKMSKEDQYACVAHLGFSLHRRSEEESSGSDATKGDETTNDVTARVMLQEIEAFLKSRNLISEGAQQRTEAKLFIELMKVEAGLIVERGADENGEVLYGFVHRTFQEYFAAADVYERFQQEIDLDIISNFLADNLHDPHWHEVILLLLGKLKPRPVTSLLRYILLGTIRSRRSVATAIVQQDLFFICDCLVEEIAVENELVVMIIARLSDLVKHSLFPTQQKEALEYFRKLMQTRQYSSKGRQALVELLYNPAILDNAIKFEALLILYQSTNANSSEWEQVRQLLTALLKGTLISINEVLQIAVTLFQSNSIDSHTYWFATQMLVIILKRPDLLTQQAYHAALTLCQYSLAGSQERRWSTQILRTLLQSASLSADLILQAVVTLYQASSPDRDQRLLAKEMFDTLFEHRRLTDAWRCQTALTLYQTSSADTEPHRQAKLIISALLRGTELSADQAIRATTILYQDRSLEPSERRLVTEKLTSLIEHPTLSIHQRYQIAIAFYQSGFLESRLHQFARQTLNNFLQNPQLLSAEQTLEMTITLYKYSRPDSYEWQLATDLLITSFQSRHLYAEQAFQAAIDLYQNNQAFSHERRIAEAMLSSLLRSSSLSTNLTIQATMALYRGNWLSSGERQLITEKLTSLIQRSDLSSDQKCQAAIVLYKDNPVHSEPWRLAAEMLNTLLQVTEGNADQALQAAVTIYQNQLGFQGIETLKTFLQRPNLFSADQLLQTAIVLSQSSTTNLDDRRMARQVVISLLQRPDLTPDQVLRTAIASYQSSLAGSSERRMARQMLGNPLKSSALSVDAAVQSVIELFNKSSMDMEKRLLAVQILLALVTRADRSEGWDSAYGILRLMVFQFDKFFVDTNLKTEKRKPGPQLESD